MASIYKRPGTAKWQAQYYVKDPATGDLCKVRKSTRQGNKKKARAIADEMERNAQAVIQAGSDRAQRAKAVFAEAVSQIEMEIFTAPTARKHLAKLLAIATGEVLVSYSVESWIKEWLERKERSTGKATKSRYTGHTESFLSWLGNDRRKKPLESLTGADARKWLDSLLAEGRAGKTVAGYSKDLSAVFRSAIREGIVTFNPFSALDAIDTSDSLARKPFNSEEVAKLLKHATTDEWRGLILVAAFTGLRLGDAAGLTWDKIDLDSNRITLIPSKTKRKKREVRIPIQTDLLVYLKRVQTHEGKQDAPVFETLAKIAVGAREGLSQTFNKIMLAAEVSRGKPSRIIEEGEKKSAGNVVYERGFHSLRHTFTSWLRNAGVSEEDRMALTGHTTRESHQGYSHADEEALSNAIAKLPGLTSPQ